MMIDKDQIMISVLGLGYVGLPLALAFSEKFDVIGFDIDQGRIDQLNREGNFEDRICPSRSKGGSLRFTSVIKELIERNIYIICVPTDIDQKKKPNLNPLKSASRIVGNLLKLGDMVIYESTVYPGCTEDDCLPILEKHSGLKVDHDFTIGYSPERIVPGSNEKGLKNIQKIVAASNIEGLARIASLYQSIIVEPIYKAPSIKVAEAAKVLENTQRYINISLMNEMAMLFKRMNIDTQEVVKAASTKWNFNPYFPGLVGGHCISIDPFYLLHKANELGMDSPFIQAGNHINNRIPEFINASLVEILSRIGEEPTNCNVLVMGVTFKENIDDIRNSKAFDLIKELKKTFRQVDAYDPRADAAKVQLEYDLTLISNLADDYAAVIVTVAHEEFLKLEESFFIELMKVARPILFDIKSIYKPSEKMIYWNL